MAAPLVLMAVAVGFSAHAEHQRQMAIAHITELLEQLNEANLDEERNELDGCRGAIDKATAIVLDEGKLGLSLGLDSAVHEIDKALATAERRLKKWQQALVDLADDAEVEIKALDESFPGIDEDGGRFRSHLEIAALAIALKRRVVLLQAVDHSQINSGNVFENFTRTLKADQQRLDELENAIAEVLVTLSKLVLVGGQSWRRPVITSNEANRLMRAARRIRALGDGASTDRRPADVAIDIARNSDGSVVVFPAAAT